MNDKKVLSYAKRMVDKNNCVNIQAISIAMWLPLSQVKNVLITNGYKTTEHEFILSKGDD